MERQCTKCKNKLITSCNCNCNSAHQLFVIDLKFRQEKLTKPPTVLQFDYTTVSDDYKVEISNRVESLLQCDDEKPPNELWKEGKSIILSTAKRHTVYS